MLKLRGVYLHYERLPLFESFDLTLPPGKWMALLGRSGVGKSSLLRFIAGLHERATHPGLQSGGERSWAGYHDFSVAYLAQQDALLPWLTAWENALLPFSLSGKVPPEDQAKQWFERMGLSASQHKKPGQLSGGMRQRVALIRTLLQDEPLVLMDEPFSSLDAITRLEMQRLSRSYLKAAEASVLLVTHDPWEALALADEILVLGGQPAIIQAKMACDPDVPLAKKGAEYHMLLRVLENQ